MRALLHRQLDSLLLPLLRLAAPGYRQRALRYRPPGPCDTGCLAHVQAPPPAAVQTAPAGSWQGWPGQRFVFPSPLDCGCPESRHTAGLALTARPGAPWVVIVPGFATGLRRPADFGLYLRHQARALLERGVNVALIEPPLHMSRRRQGCVSGEGLFQADLHLMQAAILQGAADVIATVRWLQQRHGAPVGVWGTSLGGCLAGLAATQLPDLAALVLQEALDNPGTPLAAVPAFRAEFRRLSAGALAPDAVPAALAAVAPSRHRPALPGDRILFIIPIWDQVVPASAQEAFWQAWGSPPCWRVPAGHLTAVMDRRLAQRVAGHLAERLAAAAPGTEAADATFRLQFPT